MPTPAQSLAAAIAALAAVFAVKVTKPPTPSSGWNNCQTVEQVFYSGDSLFYVRPLGSKSRDSLVKADSTKDTAVPYGPQILLCNDSVLTKSREVVNSGFGRIP